ncbi:type II secretion system protein GspH, partial [Burkholderia territorii]
MPALRTPLRSARARRDARDGRVRRGA